jgi:uncharacterized tellurite resistance protein B-like protein
MPKTDLIMALAKVIIAAAWADGEVANEEINSLKDLLFQLPNMTAKDWVELDIYIETPVNELERTRLVEELKSSLSTSADKSFILSTLETMILSDGVVTEKERAVVEEIKSALEGVSLSIFGKMGKLVSGPLQRRSEVLVNAPNRELYLEDFIKNKVFFNLRQRLAVEELPIDLPESSLRKLCLAGGLMARVAYVDREVTEGEFDAMVAAIRANWEATQEEASLVAEVAVSEIGKDLDLYRLSRQFFENTTMDERVHFLDVLFAVAEGDGHVSNLEIEEIRTISNLLKMTHRQFITAKTKIPRENRAN